MAAAVAVAVLDAAEDEQPEEGGQSPRWPGQQFPGQIAMAMRSGLGHVKRDETWAARKLQALGRARTAKRHRLKRAMLHDRVHLEATLLVGLRVILLCLGLFAVLMLILRSTSNTSARFGLRETYEDVFRLGEISDIATVPVLQAYLRQLSTSARSLQALSSDYFVEREGELKILRGIQRFDEPVQVEVSGLMPRISPAFSFAAWVERPATVEGYVVRKPLGQAEEEEGLSCYGWWVGARPRLDFGAHDYGGLGHRGAERQESAAGASSGWKSGELHLEVVVVNQTHASFFQDAMLRSETALRRPVTDCAGKALLVGAEGLRLGELTYFARGLSATEIEEIFFAGFTLEAIAAGKLPFAPEESEFDRLRAGQSEAATAAERSRTHLLLQQQHAAVLSQSASASAAAAAAPAAPLPTARAPPAPGCSRDWPSCNVITDVADGLAIDPVTGHDFYDLMPPSLRNGAAEKARMAVPGPPEFNHFDAATFPRWKGRSVSFSAWVRAEAGTGYLITKSPDFAEQGRCWTFHLELNGLANIGGAVTDGWTHPNVFALLPTDLDFGFAHATALRHVVQVFDVETNSLRGYLDGELFAESAFEEPGAVARLDCDVTERTYVGFMHRAPGSAHFVGDVQDVRMYVGTALSDEEVRSLAMHAGGAAQRECKLLNESSDSQFKDINGNDCAWYQEARQSRDTICGSEEVLRECPVACEAHLPCYQPQRKAATPVHTLWERVMHLTANDGEQQVVCVRDGLEAEAVAACRRLRAERDPRAYPAPGAAPFNSWHSYVDRERSQQARPDLNVTDCELLGRTINPYCSFSPAGAWTRGFDAEVAASGGMTTTFWFRAPPGVAPNEVNIMLLSSVAPPVPVVAFFRRTSGLLFGTVWGGCGVDDREDAFFGGEIAGDRWVHVSVVFGALSASGQREVRLAVDSVLDRDLSPWQWCPQSSGETVQAVVVGSELLLSPIRFRAEALSPKQLQAEYYELRPAFRLLRGPSVSDAARLAERIDYHRPLFSAPAVLVAPPILLQTRASPADCASTQGNAFVSDLWHTALEGSTCAAPYRCPDDLLASSDALLLCAERGRSSSTLESYFGRPSLELGGEQVFPEFLASIADGEILVRAGTQYQTASFIDTTTSKVNVLLVGFSVQDSIVTTVEISARIGSRVVVTYEMLHLSSVEGSDLRSFSVLAAVAAALVVCNALEIAYDAVLHLREWRERRLRQREMADAHAAALRELRERDRELSKEERLGSIRGRSKIARAQSFHAHEHAKNPHRSRALKAAKSLRVVLFDVLVLVLFPLAFVAVRLFQARGSGSQLVGTVGGLGAVPWASKAVELEDKMESFFRALEELQSKIRVEQRVNTVGFVVGLLLLLRSIYATKAHPRISVLVSTLGSAADDLWHFLLLFLLMFCGFAALAAISFGGDRREFASLSASFETLFDMMLGTVPIDSDGRSSLVIWSADPMLVVFVVLFNFLIFFVMLNFIIAIIVESYLKAKKAVENDETEQEFITDCVSSMGTMIKGKLQGWPSHRRLEAAMAACVRKTVGVDTLEVYFPTHTRAALFSLVRHYERFDFMAPAPASSASRKTESAQPDQGDLAQMEAIAAEVERRVAAMLNVPVLSAGDRLLRLDRLNNPLKRQNSISRDTGSSHECTPRALSGSSPTAESPLRAHFLGAPRSLPPRPAALAVPDVHPVFSTAAQFASDPSAQAAEPPLTLSLRPSPNRPAVDAVDFERWA